MIYQWTKTSHLRGDANRVGAQLEAIREENEGRLAPRDVVVAARPDGSPLHPFFEWRDTIAALKYREEQARSLIRSVAVIYDEAPDTPVRAFVCVGDGEDDGGAYQSTRIAMANQTDREYVLGRALRELDAWKKRYAHLTELAEVFSCLGCIGKQDPSLEAAA